MQISGCVASPVVHKPKVCGPMLLGHSGKLSMPERPVTVASKTAYDNVVSELQLRAEMQIPVGIMRPWKYSAFFQISWSIIFLG